MIGILTPILLAQTSPTNIGNDWQQKLRDWHSEQNRTPIEEVLNNAETEYEDGCNATTEQEELLQLPSSEGEPSSGRGHDRCDDRSGVRDIQEGESESSGCGHTREEDKGSRRESTGD